MSRLTPPLSVSDSTSRRETETNATLIQLLSNLSALSASTTTQVSFNGTYQVLRDLTVIQEENTAFVTEQFLPRKQDAVFSDPFVFQTSATNQHIRARLIMLSPFPSDTVPLAKSVAYLSSRFGSIKAEVVSAFCQVVT
jgi:hypothetical protein